jgi:hypothetical protein
VHDIKFDGYRLQARLGDGQTIFYPRRGYRRPPYSKSRAVSQAVWIDDGGVLLG